MTWKCLVYGLSGQCSGICGGTSYRKKSDPSFNSVEEMDVFKINDDDDDDDFLSRSVNWVTIYCFSKTNSRHIYFSSSEHFVDTLLMRGLISFNNNNHPLEA